MKTILFLIASLFLFAEKHDNVPGKKQSHPILLKGGTLYTITNGIQKNTDLLFENGKITQIGKNLSLPAKTEVIDISGKYVYPGLISLHTKMGLEEIGAVRSTRDFNEVGQFNSEVMSKTAYNADSEVIPTVRSNGVTHSLIVPQGAFISGQSSLMQLDAWNNEDALVKANVGMHLFWPNMTLFSNWNLALNKQEENIQKNLKKIHHFFESVQNYLKQGSKNLQKNLKYEAMRDLFNQKQSLFVHANTFKQLRAAILFADEFKLKLILVGADDALLLKEMIQKRNIPLILNQSHRLPRTNDSNYDHAFTLPQKLKKLSIPFAISTGGTWKIWSGMNLAFQAGQAVAFGLDRETALQSLTLNPAKFLGLSDRLGSLELGKEASLIVSDGDILDYLTNKVRYEFIEGRKVDLNNRHKTLYKKYRQRGQK